MLDLPDIQGIVFSGHGNMPHARFLFLQVQDRKQAQSWLLTLIPCIVTGERRPKDAPKPKTSAHIAFTAPGLQALGLDPDALATFPREFTEGMSSGERPRVLGDTGDSAPQNWQFGGPNTPSIHLLLALYATSETAMEALTQEAWYPAQVGSGVGIVYQQESFRRTDNEPFGFRDGISQPAIAGGPVPAGPGQSVLSPGEFLLGHENGYNNLSPMPTIAAGLDAASLLPPDTTAPVIAGRRAIGYNGSFLVLRKLSQDVDGFWKFCETQTLTPDGAPDPARKTWLAAKIVGRWPSGAPLTLAPDQDNQALGADNRRNNDFLFSAKDSAGFACPIGSHVRRSNPRDALQPNSPAHSLVIANRHRLMRRGRPYEEPLLSAGDRPSTVPAAPETPGPEASDAEPARGGPGERMDRGLIFIALNADLQRQFEFVQQTWINNANFNGLYNNKDPLVADNDGSGDMTLQRDPVRKQIQNVPRFVTVKGGGYFFLPGIKALRFLANLP